MAKKKRSTAKSSEPKRRRRPDPLRPTKAELPTRRAVRGYWFDSMAAHRAVAFFPRYLRHREGRLAGERFFLEKWQRTIVEDVFGWKRKGPNGQRLQLRRYRVVYIEIPRGNGKSTFAAGLALILLAADGERAAQVYSAARDRSQAKIVYSIARSMVERSRPLLGRIRCLSKRLVYAGSGSFYEALSADIPTKHGLNAHGVLFDEFHVQDDRDLYDVLHTSTIKRENPLEIILTTAGFNRHSICYAFHMKALDFMVGKCDDPRFYGVVYGIDEEADWTSPKSWRKANPNLGVSVLEEDLAAECEKAKEDPAFENTFRRLHLNQWTEQEVRWIQMVKWDRCADPIVMSDLKGRICYAGLDLASTTDMSALALVFPRDDLTFDVLLRYWCPVEGLRRRVKRDKVSYDVWSRKGYLSTTPGDVTDYRVIKRDILKLAETYQIHELAFDRWNASQLITELGEEGVECVGFGQGFFSMSAPTKELMTLVLSRRLRHGGNPILRWNARNVVVSMDPAENLKPNKKKSIERIDGIVAVIMGLGRAIVHAEEPPSVYQERGLISV